MASPTGFLDFHRVEVPHRSVEERIRDWYEIDRPLVAQTLREQAARCMDCGIPFCHGYGCPVKNRIPEFNDLVYKNRWREATANLHSTNNFPEITGRVCPAPCEAACTLNVNDDPVTIKHIEYQIAERAWAEGWTPPVRPARRTGKKAAVIGSGPSGLAVAQQLARSGHEVIVFEKDDCVGTSIRQGALSVTQIEILPKPPASRRNPETPWPSWPKVMRTSSSHEEGCQRHWSVQTKALAGTAAGVTELHACEVEWSQGSKGWQMSERPGSEFVLQADLVLLAMGFLHVAHEGLVEQMGLETNGRGNLVVNDWMCSQEGVFAAGDSARGASLVVHAINEGRLAAAAVDRWLMVG